MLFQKNVPILKNNESTIVNLANLYNKGTHWIAMKFINNKLFYFDSYGIPYVPDVIRKKYPNSKITTNIYRVKSNSSNECGKFYITFIKSNIKMNLIILNFYYNSKKIILKKMIYSIYDGYFLLS